MVQDKNNGEPKMKWLANKIRRNNIVYRIHKSNLTHGTVVLPTGVGKSGEIFIDMYYHIINHKHGEKLILNLSAPVLKLVQQQTCDFLQTLSLIQEMIPTQKLSFFINSSDNGKNYNQPLKEMDLNCKKFKTDFYKFFLPESDSEIAIVATCHKSLNKYIDKIATLRKDNVEFTSITYIDESHLVDYRNNNDDDSISTIKLDKLCKCSSVYALTATPNNDVTRFINSFNKYGKHSTKPIYDMSPIDAIAHNYIVKPKIYTRQTDTNGLSTDVLVDFMEHSKIDNPNIKHKMLVTCKSSEELKALKLDLEKAGYNVFSTCSRYGFGTEENFNNPYSDINGFIDDIDNYDGDCFVIHIRQLIQGIDINSITDVVMWCQDVLNPMTARHTIQTIGRALRTLKGERGMCIEKRKKKHSNIYILSNDTHSEQQKAFEKFVMNTYALNNHDFYNSYGGYKVKSREMLDTNAGYKVKKDVSADKSIVAVPINVETYIREKLSFKKNMFRGLGKVLNINYEINNIIKNYKLTDNMGTDDILSADYRKMFNDLSKICQKYNIC